MIGTKLSHYRLLEQIGAGGMGVVYRAHDEHLDRDVAVKVLPAGILADDAARQRFRREAHALSRLNHPHIATVHDFDTQDGIDFLVMELVDGEPLTERIHRGASPEAEVCSLGGQIAAALEAAHRHQVVHRDLKPGNILVSADGQVKVLDFGLAKVVRPAGGLDLTKSLTEADVTVGTIPYMAPEQLLGQKVDARADLYSLGVVLYELATGRSPYREKIPTALVCEIVHQPVPAPRSIAPQLSERIDAIILRCLEKDAVARYASARALLLDLREPLRPVAAPTRRRRSPVRRRWLIGTAAGIALAGLGISLDIGGVRGRLFGGGGSPAFQALAVLPFENLSRDSTQAYFADGMTDELITRLTQVGALRVRPRASVLPFLGTAKPLSEIARVLRVDAVVTGSVLRSGDRTRISAQLVRTRDQVSLWADSFEGDLKDVLGLQSQVARAVAENIRVKLSGAERARLAQTKTVDPRAHEAYLRGQYALQPFTRDGFQQAIRYFNEAIGLDPTYAQPFVGLASAYFGLSSIYEPANVAMPKARAAARHALELDPNLGDAHALLAIVRGFYDWERSEAEGDFKRAIELQPGSAIAHDGYSGLLLQDRRFDQMIAEGQRGYEIDPLSLGSEIGVAVRLHYTGRYDEAIAVLRKLLETHPTSFHAHLIIGQCLLWKQDLEGGLAEIMEAHRIVDVPTSLGWLGYAYAVSGRTGDARRVLAELESRSKREFVQPFCFAVINAGLGDKDRAFEWLDKGIATRSEDMGTIQIDRAMDPLRSDPRYQTLLRRMGFVPGIKPEPPQGRS